MSELKVHRFLCLDEVWPDATIGKDYYLKSEADKVIAHQKYKRCLAMVKWCEEVDLFGGYTSNYWMRWRNKWLELAEKFKES